MNAALEHALERRVLIHAPRATVFRYFMDSERFARWWGAGSTIDPRVGGHVLICFPGGVRASGNVVEIVPPERIVLTYGLESGRPVPPGGSQVTIELDEDAHGTTLRLLHEFPDAAARDEHVQGWRYQLAVFANVVANEVNADAARRVDGWFAAWSEPDAVKRRALLDPHVASDVRFRDRFSLVNGLADLEPHLAAVHTFMPNLRLERDGVVRHCQGTVVANWVMRSTDGTDRGRGTNVFTLDATGRIRDVVGLWGE
jgi:uncharacterized protein YndB with AHSA1/START domain